MDLSLIISIVGNILLFLLLVLFVILYFTTYANTPYTCPVNPSPQNPIVPSICTDASCNYIIKTLDGKFLTSCFSCSSSSTAGQLSVVASDKFNGDTVKFINVSNTGNFQIQMNIANDPSNTYYFNLTPETITKGVLKLTTNPNERGTVFNLIPYLFSYSSNANGSNIYQIGTPLSNTLLGEAGESNCKNTNEGKGTVPIVDGFNFYVNTPNGLNSKSLFLIIPSITYGPQPTPVNPPPPVPIVPPPPTPITPPGPSPAPSSECDTCEKRFSKTKQIKCKSKKSNSNLILFE